MIRRRLPIHVLFLLLAACNADTETVQVNTASLTEMRLPEVLRTVSAIDPADMQLQVIVNNEATSLLRGRDNIWRGSVDVPINQQSQVSVEWGADFGNSGYVKLAEQQRFVNVGAAERTIAFNNSYVTAFDDDNDTRINLEEFEQNRSPVSRKDVFIGAAGTTGEGIAYPASDVCGQKIPISVVTQGTGSGGEDDMWWCATLRSRLIDIDGNNRNIENLEITVYVEDDLLVHDGSSFAEDQVWHDDSIEIYIDGDNNKRGPYDGINDFQFRYVPVGDGEFSIARGPSSFSSSNMSSSFEYFNGGYILTANIPLQEVGIRKGFEFGINVEVSDDDNQGDANRDAKYAWVAAEGVDDSWLNTQLFGTSQVQ